MSAPEEEPIRIPKIHLPFPKLGYPEPIELERLIDAAYATPGQTSDAVRAFTAAGVPAGSAHAEVYAPPSFALAWAGVVNGYKRTPLKGARLKRAVERAAKQWRAAGAE